MRKIGHASAKREPGVSPYKRFAVRQNLGIGRIHSGQFKLYQGVPGRSGGPAGEEK